MGLSLLPPDDWNEFEDMVRDYAAWRFNGYFFERYGRKGQNQHGIDIKSNRYQICIQVKLRNNQTYKKFTAREIQNICDLANNEGLPIQKFFIALSAERDATLQDAVEKIRDNYPFEINLIFWDDIKSFLQIPEHWEIREKYSNTNMERPWGREILSADDYRRLLRLKNDFGGVMKYFIDKDPVAEPIDIFMIEELDRICEKWSDPALSFASKNLEKLKFEIIQVLLQFPDYLSLEHMKVLGTFEDSGRILRRTESIEDGMYIDRMLKPAMLRLRTALAKLYRDLYKGKN